ncbi:MAG: hypothetical protein GX159_07970 [Flavobacteriaceae bacterium]|jgi:hypothetical protein|nr:hypothetical protein [Flavobacteriaceae bacterium]
MATINIKTDCGNAPKKEFLKQLHIALAQGDSAFVIENIADDVHWEIIGNHTITNKQELEKRLSDNPLWNVTELNLDAIITHGNEASANGSVVTAENLKFAFCNMYKFRGFKGPILKHIKTYIIELK